MYVNNANYVRPNYNIRESITDLAAFKKAAEARMKSYDQQPLAVRQAINEYGQLRAAVFCRSKKPLAKVMAVEEAYMKKLERTSVEI